MNKQKIILPGGAGLVGQNLVSRLGNVKEVVPSIGKGISPQGKPVVYAPAKWTLIMMIIRHLPRFFFNKLDI